MLTSMDLWVGLALPAALAGGVLVAGWRIAHRRASARDSRSWAGPVAVAAAFIAGYWGLLGRPDLPPLDATDWLFYLAGALAVPGLADALLRLRLPARVVLITVAVAASFLVLGWPLLRLEGEAAADARAQATIAAVLATASIVALDALAVRISAVRLSGVLLAVAVPAAVVVVLSGSQRLGQIGGLLAAIAMGMVAANVALGRAAVGRGTVLVFGTLLGGLLLCAHLYAELTTANAMLLAAAPNMAWLGYLVPKRAGHAVNVIAQLLLVLSIAAIAVVRAYLVFVQDAEWY